MPAATASGVVKFGGFFGNAVSQGAAFAVGAATAPTLAPILEDLKNTTWRSHPSKAVDAGTAAGIVAEGVEARDWGASEAAAHGIDGTRFDAMLGEALNAPDIGTLFNLWRRGYVTEDGFRHGLRKAKLETSWDAALERLKISRLDPAQTAAAIHRGLVPDPGLLKGEQPSGPRNVESYPVYPIDALTEALSNGYDEDRLGVLVGLQGLPMGVIEAALAYYRGIITHGDYIAAFNESNNRNEWAEAVLEYAKQIPTARDFFENALRGYHDLAWAQEQAKRHGMSDEDSLVIYQNQGRPMNIRQITQALSRGAKFNPEPGELTDPYDASVVEGNVKPAYYELAKALKYTLPSPFVMRQLTSSGVWSEAKAAKRLKDSGWIPEDADEAAHAWASTATGGAESYVKKAQAHFWTTTLNSYVAGEMNDSEADDNLKVLGLNDADRATVLQLWKYERDTTRKQLTPTQVKKAFAKLVTNPATAKPWTRQDAIDALLARGFSFNDAETFLDTP